MMSDNFDEAGGVSSLEAFLARLTGASITSSSASLVGLDIVCFMNHQCSTPLQTNFRGGNYSQFKMAEWRVTGA